MSALQYSEFDSEIFGLRFLRVAEFDAGRLAEAMAQEAGDAPLIIDAKLPAENSAMIDTLLGLGFQKAATMVAFRRLPGGSQTALAQCATELVLGPDDLAAHAAHFTFQRFYQDPRISREATRRLMRTWIANSLGGRREVLAIGRNFCTFSTNDTCLTIDLLSCLDGGKGIASRLLQAVLATAQARGLSEVHVTTEAENARAMATYAKAGFSPRSSAVALHFVRGAVG